jgi:signal transduction histidine kinase
MRIQKIFLLSITASLAISFFVILAVLSILQDREHEAARVRVYSQIEKKNNALNLSIARFPNRPDASRIDQIWATSASLDNLLGSLNSQDIIETALIRHIIDSNHELGYLLEKLIASSSEPAGVSTRERQNVLISHLRMKSQFILDDIQRLMEISQSEIDAAQNRAKFFIVCLIVALVLINTAISLFASKSIIRVQEGLRKSLERAEEGERLTRQAQLRLAEAQRIAKVGDWEWDSVKDDVSWSEAMYDIFGRSPELSAPTYKEHRRYFTNDSWTLLDDSVKAALESGKSYELELENIREDGSQGWFIAQGEVLLDSAGHIAKLRGTAQDITARKLSEESLRKSEERFRAIVSSSSEVIYRMSPDWSEMRQLQSKGFLANTEKPNRNWLKEYIYTEDQPQVTAAIKEAIRNKETFVFEHRVRRADGSVGWTFSRAVPLLHANGEIVEWFGAASDITERKKAEETLRQWSETLEQQVAERTELAKKRARQLQSLSVELIEAEERERRRIAQLLHDDLQQIIAAARFQLQTFRQEMPAEPVLINIEKLLEESIRKSRRITHELSPAILEHSSLFSALQWLARHMGDQFGLQVELTLGAAPPPASQPLKVFTFRTAQELLFNVHKHSGVKVAEVELSNNNDRLVLTVSDRGRGFDPESLDSAIVKDGFGLLSLRERVDYIGGNMLIESAQGQGSKFILTIPVNSFETPESPTDDLEQVSSADAATDRCIRVLLADAHELMRKSLVKMLSRQPDIEIAGEAANGREVIELARQIKPDVILMDTAMPDTDGIETTRLIKAELPNVHVIGLSIFPDEQYNNLMRAAGADAFISKSGSSAELLEAIYGTCERVDAPQFAFSLLSNS